jgi:hypothetical protein
MTSSETVSAEQARQDTERWLERAVIGLNLCPFAKAVHVKGQIRYAIYTGTDTNDLLDLLMAELQLLTSADPALTDTTLLIAPQCLVDFSDFNDFLGLADRVLRDLGLEGELQIASLHPHYRFADTSEDDITNFTNRSPHPTLHLLREASIDRAVAAFPHAEDIFETNMRRMQMLGVDGWASLGLKASS